MEEAKFPLFRRYNKEPVFFRIDSDRKYTELKLIGGKLYALETRVCSMFPDLMLIQDLIECKTPVIVCAQDEYGEVLELAMTNRVRV